MLRLEGERIARESEGAQQDLRGASSFRSGEKETIKVKDEI